MAKQKATAKDVEEGKACAALSYLLVGVIWYFADEKMRKNAFAGFHARQGLVFLIVWVGVSIFAWILYWIPVIGWILNWLLWLSLFVLFVLGIVNAVNGETKELPVIGSWAKAFKF